MSKRILALVLSLVMVLGTFGTVFAAGELTADIDDVSVVKAVERLAAFEIVNGMEDGKYHPELDVTREQFAKLVVEATGLGSAALATGGTSRFKDVATSRWSVGYVNVAEGQGIIKGYPDGTFRPENKVTYAEAVTMLVRALGYKDEFLQGTWPGNYVAKAAEVGITTRVSFNPSGVADRGSAAILVNNALDADVIKITSYEGATITYTETDVILMTDKLSIDKVENIRLITTSRLDTALNDDEVRILVIKDDTYIDGKRYYRDDEVDVNVVEDINIEGLLGSELIGYFEDDLMIFSEKVTSETSTVRGIAYDDEGDGTILSLETGKYYDYASDAMLFVNNEDRTPDLNVVRNRSVNLNGILKEYDPNYSYAYGTLTLEKGKVTFADLSVYEIVSGVVQDVNATSDVIQYIDTWEAVEEEDLNLGDYDEFHILALDGSKMDIKDIEVGDRIYFYEDAQDDEIAYVMVDQRDLVTGTLTEFRSGNAAGSGTRGRVYIDDKAYGLANDWTYSLDSMDSFTAANRFDNLKDSLDDVLDQKATLYLDTKGRVSLLESDVDSTSDNYGVAVRAGSTVRDEVKLWVPAADDTITYEIDSFENGIKLSDIEDNDIVKYDINSDGTIDILAIVYKADGNQANRIEDNSNVLFQDVRNITTTSVQLADLKYYFNTTKSSYIDYSDYKARGFVDDEDLEALTWKDFEDTVVAPGTKVLLVTDGDSKDIEFMAFIDGYDNIASEDLYVGYLIKARETADVMTLTIAERGKGEVEYKVTKTADKNEFRQNVERPIVYTLSGEGIKLKNPATTINDGVEQVRGLVTSRSGNDLYVDGSRYVMENNVVIWEADDTIGKYDLVKDYPVVMLLQDGKVAVIAWDYDNDPVKAAKAAQVDYLAAGGAAADAVYVAVVNALAADPQVPSDIVTATTALKSATTALNNLSAEAKAVKAVKDAVLENDKAKFITALQNSLFDNYVAAYSDLYWALPARTNISAPTTTALMDAQLVIVNSTAAYDIMVAAITEAEFIASLQDAAFLPEYIAANNDLYFADMGTIQGTANLAAAKVALANVNATAPYDKLIAATTYTQYITALKDAAFAPEYMAANDAAYWAAEAAIRGAADITNVKLQLIIVNDAEAVKVAKAALTSASLTFTNATTDPVVVNAPVAHANGAAYTITGEVSGGTTSTVVAPATATITRGATGGSVVLTVTITKNAATDTVTYTVTVPATPAAATIVKN